RAAVLEAGDRAVHVAGDDDRRLADIGGRIVTRIRQLRFQAQEVPGLAFEEAGLLLLRQVLVVVEPVGHARGPLRAFLVGVQHVASHSGSMPADWMTPRQRVISSRTNWPICCGVPATGSTPMAARRWAISGLRTEPAMMSWMRFTISAGVFAGAAAANHAT